MIKISVCFRHFVQQRMLINIFIWKLRSAKIVGIQVIKIKLVLDPQVWNPRKLVEILQSANLRNILFTVR